MVDVEDMIEDLAEARNRSAQVDDKSLAELQNILSLLKTQSAECHFMIE